MKIKHGRKKKKVKQQLLDQFSPKSVESLLLKTFLKCLKLLKRKVKLSLSKNQFSKKQFNIRSIIISKCLREAKLSGQVQIKEWVILIKTRRNERSKLMWVRLSRGQSQQQLLAAQSMSTILKMIASQATRFSKTQNQQALQVKMRK